ncbi:amidohydrolase [Alkalihalobacillus oceani]|uniref:5-methylthioadenosine/S-adenosylhomocysteine deaminase n=1 Tax=Halalkalibacter oceani TaxID=1653776 RepID=A0A9X2INM7_9BACI|nr:amidohydrolase [Halalkalibacter oceani]MCM3713557.1 amidohydrolase [Halalkalibacter oceani]
MLLLKDAAIVTMDKENPFIDNGFLVIADGKLIEVGSGSPSEKQEADAAEVISVKGKWLMPGLINTHGHIGMTLLRGHSDDLPLHRWLEEKMWPFEGKQDEEAVHAGRALALAEMVKSGTTTFLEMYHLYMDQCAEAVEEAGMRATLMRSMIGLCSKEEQEAKLGEAVRFAKQWHERADGRIRTMLAPHAPYTCPPAFIERIVEEAVQLQLPVHMHLAETKKEVADHLEQYGCHPLDHLDQLGVLDAVPWLFAHGVHLAEAQLERLARTEATISYNPKSNLKLGSGIAPVKEMLERGIRVSFGTDSVAANNTLDLFEELRIGNLLQKGSYQDATALSAGTTLELATINGAEALQFPELGKLKAGYQADFILLDGEQLHVQPAAHVLSHLVYAVKAADVTDVFVQGKALMRNRSLLTLDEEKIRYQANRQYKKVCSLM